MELCSRYGSTTRSNCAVFRAFRARVYRDRIGAFHVNFEFKLPAFIAVYNPHNRVRVPYSSPCRVLVLKTLVKTGQHGPALAAEPFLLTACQILCPTTGTTVSAGAATGVTRTASGGLGLLESSFVAPWLAVELKAQMQQSLNAEIRPSSEIQDIRLLVEREGRRHNQHFEETPQTQTLPMWPQSCWRTLKKRYTKFDKPW